MDAWHHVSYAGCDLLMRLARAKKARKESQGREGKRPCTLESVPDLFISVPNNLARTTARPHESEDDEVANARLKAGARQRDLSQ